MNQHTTKFARTALAGIGVCLAIAMTTLALAENVRSNIQDQDDQSSSQSTSSENAASKNTAAQDADKAALAEIQNMVIGQWRGVGQPRRGSSRDNWIENAAWSWEFEGERATLAFTAEDGRFYVAGKLSRAEKDGEFKLIGVTADGQEETYTGSKNEDGALIFATTESQAGRPARISLRNVADGDRLLILFERRLAEDRFARLAEVGYTRQGSGFGEGATAGPECVVTGGLGTIEVSHEGKTYYVCCSGCQDLFNDDPARILAEYAKRKEEEKNKKGQ